MLKEFKKFALKGNMIDLAVGMIIGTAFNKLVSSLVNDMFMPFLGYIIGDMDLTKLNVTLAPAVVDAAGNVTKEAVVLGIGTLLSVIIDFLLPYDLLTVSAFRRSRRLLPS